MVNLEFDWVKYWLMKFVTPNLSLSFPCQKFALYNNLLKAAVVAASLKTTKWNLSNAGFMGMFSCWNRNAIVESEGKDNFNPICYQLKILLIPWTIITHLIWRFSTKQCLALYTLLSITDSGESYKTTQNSIKHSQFQTKPQSFPAKPINKSIKLKST